MASLTWINDLAAGWPAWMADVSVRVTALMAAAWLICRLLRRHSAALRHTIWVMSLAAVAATPFLLDVTPKLRVPVVWAESDFSDGGQQDALPIAGTNLGPGLNDPSPAVSAREKSEAPDFEAIVPIPAAGSADVGTPPSLASILAGVWVLGFLVLAVRLAAGHIRLRQVAREARVAENFEDLVRRLEVGRPVRFLQSSAETMPMTWGWRRPTVLLPSNFEEWDPQRHLMTVLHELAHIKRGDWLTQTFAQLVCAVHWFHPLVWLAVRRTRIEADRACDDRVLRAGSKASNYAEHLVQTARQFRGVGLRPWVAIAMAHPSSLDQRVRYVLDNNVDRAGLSLGRGFAVALAVTAITLAVPSVEAVEKTDSAGRAAPPRVEVVDPPAAEPINGALPNPPEVLVEPVKQEPILLAQAARQSEPSPPPQVERAQQRLEQAERKLEERRQRAEERVVRAAERAERRRRPELSPEAQQTAASALRKALGSPDAEVRAEAAEALGRLGAFDEANLEALEAALSDEDPKVRHEAADALGRLVRLAKQMPAEQAMRWLTPALNSSDARVRREAVEALKGLSGAAAIEAATKAIDDPEPEVQREAVQSLGRLLRSSDAETARSALPSLQRVLQHSDPKVRQEVVESLGKLHVIANDVVPLLAQAAEDPDPDVQKAAVEALGKISRRAGTGVSEKVEVWVEVHEQFEQVEHN